MDLSGLAWTPVAQCDGVVCETVVVSGTAIGSDNQVNISVH